MGGRGGSYSKNGAQYHNTRINQLMGYRNYENAEKAGKEYGFHLETREKSAMRGFIIDDKTNSGYAHITSQVSKDGDSVLIRVADSNWFKFDRKSDGAQRFGLKLDRTHVVYGQRRQIHQGSEGYAPTYIRFDKKYYNPHEVKKPFEDMAEGNGMAWDQLKKLAIDQENFWRKQIRKKGFSALPIVQTMGGLRSDSFF